MERKNASDILFSRLSEQGFKCTRRTQLDIDIFGVGQKAQEQVEALLKREIIGASFARVACGDDYRRGLATASVAAATGQDRHLAFELSGDTAEMIESKLKKIRRLAHGCGEAEIGRGCDHAHDLRARCFDRSARCHIFSDSKNQERAMIAPL